MDKLHNILNRVNKKLFNGVADTNTLINFVEQTVNKAINVRLWKVDNLGSQPSNKEIAKNAYEWAVKQGPCDETRTAACQNSFYAYVYARGVDKGSCDETRTAACKDPCYAYLYARYVDQGSCDETWQVVKGSKWEQSYIDNVEIITS